MNLKRIIATITIVVLVALYITTFIIALLDFPDKQRILAGFIMLDVAVPAAAWLLLMVHKHFGPKK